MLEVIEEEKSGERSSESEEIKEEKKSGERSNEPEEIEEEKKAGDRSNNSQESEVVVEPSRPLKMYTNYLKRIELEKKNKQA